jgi:hypothetical protein
MTLEINDYGFCVDSDWFYIALDWKVIILTSALVIAYKFYKRKKNK